MKKALVVALGIMTILTALLALNGLELKRETQRLELSNEFLKGELVKKGQSEMSLEVLACELLGKSPKTALDVDTLFLILPDIDDVKFDAACKKYGSTFDHEKAMVWVFENIESGNTKNMLNLFRLSNHLDEGLSEGYYDYMQKIYKSDRSGFIKAISQSPMNKESILSGMTVALFENEQWVEEKDHLVKMLNGDALAPSEKEAIKEFIDVLDWYIENGI